MATSPAIYAKTTLSVKVTGSFYTVQGVKNIDGPAFSRAEIDVTHMNSTALEFKGAALFDAGTMNFGIQYAPQNSVHAYLLGNAASASAADVWGLTFSDGTIWTFTGSILDFAVKADDPAKGILAGDLKVRLTGAVNFSGSLT